MPTYKVHYFPIRGRGEIVRLVFKQAGVEFEDVRVTGEEWGKGQKELSPYGFMPYVDVDGRQVSGSYNCARYFGELFGLGGKDALENSEIAGLGDAIVDLLTEIVKVHFEKDEEKKKELQEEFTTKKFPMKMSFFDKHASADRDFFFEKLTWADLAFYNVLDNIMPKQADCLDKWPNLKRVHTKVSELPNIKKWVEERPKSDF